MMPSLPVRALRTGLGLSVVVALLLFLARAAGAQEAVPTGPQRLSLGDAIRLAARQGTLTESARLRVAQAEARVRQRRADLLPSVSASASEIGRTFNTASFGFTLPGVDPAGEVRGPIQTVDLRGRASQTLFDAGAVGRVRAARGAVRAASADTRVASEQAGTIAAGAYLRAMRADAQLVARLADSSLAANLLEIARQQLAAGVGVALDVTRARAQVAGVRAQLISARNDRDRARLDLLRALDLALDTPIELTDSLGMLPLDTTGMSPGAAVARALAARPDVEVVNAQLGATRQQISAIRAERLPAVGVFGDAGPTGRTADHLLNTYSVGVQLSLPIFDGFRREGRLQEQQAVANELDVRRRDLAAQVGLEVRSALLDLSSAREQVDASQERLRLAEQELSQARERFRAGVAGNADVITASLALTGARTQLNDALAAFQGARVALARAEGTVTELR